MSGLHWLACYTQEEIAEREGIDPKTVRNILGEMAELPKVLKPAAEHLTDSAGPGDRGAADIFALKFFGPGSHLWGAQGLNRHFFSFTIVARLLILIFIRGIMPLGEVR